MESVNGASNLVLWAKDIVATVVARVAHTAYVVASVVDAVMNVVAINIAAASFAIVVDAVVG